MFHNLNLSFFLLLYYIPRTYISKATWKESTFPQPAGYSLQLTLSSNIAQKGTIHSFRHILIAADACSYSNYELEAGLVERSFVRSRVVL